MTLSMGLGDPTSCLDPGQAFGETAGLIAERIATVNGADIMWLLGDAISNFGCYDGKNTNNWFGISPDEHLDLHGITPLDTITTQNGLSVYVFASVKDGILADSYRSDATLEKNPPEPGQKESISAGLLDKSLAALAYSAVRGGMVREPFYYPGDEKKAYDELAAALVVSNQKFEQIRGYPSGWVFPGNFTPPDMVSDTKAIQGASETTRVWPWLLGASVLAAASYGIYTMQKRKPNPNRRVVRRHR
jgi:hypothetical protein